MNSASIVLDFFEVVNCFEEEPEDDREGQEINYGVYCIHFELIFAIIHQADAKKQQKPTIN
jgi:hypothetical protein